MEQSNIEVVTIAVTDLKPAAYNPRRWNDKQTAALKESISR